MSAQRTSRFALMLTSDERLAIRDFQFANRLSSEAKAARTLIELGLVSEKAKGPAEAATSPSHGSSNPGEGKGNEHD